jgi:uncharacterized membrane protein
METPTDFRGIVNFFLDFIGVLIPALFAILFIYIMWKIIDAWIIHADDETKRKEGKSLVVVAVLVFVLMISTWGIVGLIQRSLF